MWINLLWVWLAGVILFGLVSISGVTSDDYARVTDTTPWWFFVALCLFWPVTYPAAIIYATITGRL